MKKLLLVAPLALVLTGCAWWDGLFSSDDTTDMTTETTSLVSTDTRVTFKTSEGEIVIALRPDVAPKISENFYQLAESGKYNGVIFHRVIDRFMVQTGDYENGDGTGGQAFGGGNLADEISAQVSHTRGMVSMANRGPNTNGSQFFIVHQDSTYLDGNYSIFGEVVSGMPVVDKIAAAKTDMMDRPLEDIVIESVVVE